MCGTEEVEVAGEKVVGMPHGMQVVPGPWGPSVLPEHGPKSGGGEGDDEAGAPVEEPSDPAPCSHLHSLCLGHQVCGWLRILPLDNLYGHRCQTMVRPLGCKWEPPSCANVHLPKA